MSEDYLKEQELRDEIFVEEREKERAEIDKLIAERNDYKTRYLFAESGLANYKRQHAADVEKQYAAGQEKVIGQILSVADDFERAVEYNKNVESATILKEGFVNIYNKLATILSSFNVERFDATGKVFDTELHDAYAVKPTDDESKINTVAETMVPGYKIGDKVLRHAVVVVYKNL